MNGEFAANDASLQRFQAEAIAMRKLRHPNAVAVHDFDVAQDGRPFIVMELVRGRSLRTIIEEQHPLGINRTLALIRDVASALSAAHGMGIVHRDIKPDNILVCQDSGRECAKVVDFGISKLLDSGMGGPKTLTGVIMGTPEYMSPEQCTGDPGIDARSDLYSLGIILYQMLTGLLPFRADTPFGIMMHHAQTLPCPPEQVIGARVPHSLSNLVMQALEKNRNLRPQSADEFIRAIDSYNLRHSAELARDGNPTASVPDPISKANVSVRNRFRSRGIWPYFVVPIFIIAFAVWSIRYLQKPVAHQRLMQSSAEAPLREVQHFLALGHAAMDEGQYDDALANFRKAAEVYPQDNSIPDLIRRTETAKNAERELLESRTGNDDGATRRNNGPKD